MFEIQLLFLVATNTQYTHKLTFRRAKSDEFSFFAVFMVAALRTAIQSVDTGYDVVSLDSVLKFYSFFKNIFNEKCLQ